MLRNASYREYVYLECYVLAANTYMIYPRCRAKMFKINAKQLYSGV